MNVQADSILRFVAKAPIFGSLPAEGHSYIAAHAGVRTYEPGEIVAHEGSRGGFLFGVFSGSLRGLRFSPEGRRFVLTILEPDQWFGFWWAAPDGGAVMDVEAISRSICVQVPGEVMKELGRRWPRLYESLYLEVIHRTRPLFRLLDLKFEYPLRVRVALALTRLLQSHAALASNGTGVRLEITQVELAAMVFCSRQRLNKVLRGWAANGIVSNEGRKTLVVHDAAALFQEVRAAGVFVSAPSDRHLPGQA